MAMAKVGETENEDNRGNPGEDQAEGATEERAAERAEMKEEGFR